MLLSDTIKLIESIVYFQGLNYGEYNAHHIPVKGD
jgi:hypothetical protein